ncbi:MAG: preprotein translocase subunit SecD [Natronomonas sp.]
MKFSPKFREHWRVWMLVFFVVVATLALFAPVGADTNVEVEDDETYEPTASQYTNLQFGLELSGGTQVRAPLVGMVVSDLSFEIEDENDIESTVQDELDLSAGDVRADANGGTVEVFADEFVGNVTPAEFADALRAAGLDVSEDEVSLGTTSETRDQAQQVLSDKISEGGLPGGNVGQVAAPGQQFILVEVPGADREEVIELIGERGRVETVALFPDPDTGEYRTDSLVDQSDYDTGSATQEGGETYVPVTLDEEAAVEFTEAMQAYGFDQEGGTVCQYDLDQSLEENMDADPGRCLLTVQDGEVVFAAGVASDLATSFRTGDFTTNPRYRTTTTSFEDARELEINMRAGSLPSVMDIENRGTSFFLQPSLAERFKSLSVLTGFAAILAVALVVFLRYRRPAVSGPMLITAAAEVYILLGFTAAVGLPLDLSHIAGFIAVIGTGVDDLVIIADEIMQQGEVRTSRVFESRFRKAFWVIGAAAATTIVAMSPLAVLSLGDLRGFAIVTIVGVLIGVLITRPAYGDILRILILERSNRS